MNRASATSRSLTPPASWVVSVISIKAIGTGDIEAVDKLCRLGCYEDAALVETNDREVAHIMTNTMNRPWWENPVNPGISLHVRPGFRGAGVLVSSSSMADTI